MGADSKIEWTDATWNPTRGCTKVSAGCKHCYAETFAERWRGIPGHAYEQGFDPRFVPDQLDKPLHWKKPRRIFVNSMSDLFHEAFTNEQIAAVFGVMAACPLHTFQVLTKRAERMAEWFTWLKHNVGEHDPGHATVCGIHAGNFGANVDYLGIRAPWPLPNVVLMVSAENQDQADKRIPWLLATPAAVRGVSVEPMLGPVTLRENALRGQFIECPDETQDPETDPCLGCEGYQGKGGDYCGAKRGPKIDWVIAGAESGRGARPMHEDWVRSLRDQCASADVKFFYKQRIERGRKVSLPVLDGAQHAEFPEARHA